VDEVDSLNTGQNKKGPMGVAEQLIYGHFFSLIRDRNNLGEKQMEVSQDCLP
jgi:hypothetical protein